MTDKLRWFVMGANADPFIACEDEAHARALYAMLGQPYIMIEAIDPTNGYLEYFDRSDTDFFRYRGFRSKLTDAHLIKLGLRHDRDRDRVDTE